jgi:NAD(P)-dependent dehydrogenase (short-subunit alcohol dehydrogenase family)
MVFGMNTIIVYKWLLQATSPGSAPPGPAQALAEALRRQYRIDVVVDEVDLSDVAAVIQLHRHLREQGIAIDILINNAGHGLQGPFVEYAAKFCTPW